MSGINQHAVLGNVGKIETRYTSDGKAIVNLSIAVSEKWKDKSGQQQERTDWISVIVFDKPAEIISKYVNKGDKLYVQGKVKTRKWQDSNGNDRYSTETIVSGFDGKFELLGGNNGSNEKINQNTQNSNNQQHDGYSIDDDIPFMRLQHECLY